MNSINSNYQAVIFVRLTLIILKTILCLFLLLSPFIKLVTIKLVKTFETYLHSADYSPRCIAFASDYQRNPRIIIIII